MENFVGFVMQQAMILTIGLIFLGILIAGGLIVFGKKSWEFALMVVFVPIITILAGLYMARESYDAIDGSGSQPYAWVEGLLNALFTSDGGGILDSPPVLILPFAIRPWVRRVSSLLTQVIRR